eukprot:scaffold8761_cov97-Isochrysis_galbana.AAC.5
MTGAPTSGLPSICRETAVRPPPCLQSSSGRASHPLRQQARPSARGSGHRSLAFPRAAHASRPARCLASRPRAKHWGTPPRLGRQDDVAGRQDLFVDGSQTNPTPRIVFDPCDVVQPARPDRPPWRRASAPRRGGGKDAGAAQRGGDGPHPTTCAAFPPPLPEVLSSAVEGGSSRVATGDGTGACGIRRGRAPRRAPPLRPLYSDSATCRPLPAAKKVKNAFRYDDEEAVIPQHNWRQGPDFRSDRVGFEAGYAVWGTNRPKLGRFGGDAPSARVDPPVSDPRQDGVAARLLRETEQIVPLMATKKQKKRLKLKAKSGTDHNVFRWTCVMWERRAAGIRIIGAVPQYGGVGGAAAASGRWQAVAAGGTWRSGDALL